MTLAGLKSRVRSRLFTIRGILEGKIPARYLPELMRPEKAWSLGARQAHFMYRDLLARRRYGTEAETFLKSWATPRGHFIETYGLYQSVYVEDQYHARKFLKPDSVVIDAGANVGVFARLATELAPQGKVYAFEPVAYTYSLLAKNAPQAISVMKGLGIKDETKSMVKSAISTDGAMVTDSPHMFAKNNEFVETEDVAITSLDAFVREQKISRVDFIKIDTEGYERFVIEGARETIKKFKPIMVMSAYHNPDDKTVLPRLVQSICPEYSCELSKVGDEEDFIFRIF